MQDLYTATGGTGAKWVTGDQGKWINDDSWNSGDPICTWQGIECEGGEQDDGGITAIKLPSNNMVGTLPSGVFLLPALVEIDLSGNSELYVSFENVAAPIPFIENINVAGTNMRTLDGVAHASNLKHLAASGLSGKSALGMFAPITAS